MTDSIAAALMVLCFILATINAAMTGEWASAWYAFTGAWFSVLYAIRGSSQ